MLLFLGVLHAFVYMFFEEYLGGSDCDVRKHFSVGSNAGRWSTRLAVALHVRQRETVDNSTSRFVH